jgi:hypothetical protein
MTTTNLSPDDDGMEEQTARIRQAVEEYEDNGDIISFASWEAMFEDRDPFEFL